MAGSRAPVRSWTVALLVHQSAAARRMGHGGVRGRIGLHSSDLYHVPEGPRIARYLGLIGASAGRGVPRDALWQVMAASLGLDLPALASVEEVGLPASYVGQGIGLVRAGCGSATQILAGIGIDVFEEGLRRAMTPVDVNDAVEAAHAAGADGITLARNYAEMRHENLAAAGAAVRRLCAGL